jgi:transposase
MGITHIMRTGWFKSAHMKRESSYRLRLLLIQRRNLKHKFLDIENGIRHSLRVSRLRFDRVGRGAFEDAVRGVLR